MTITAKALQIKDSTLESTDKIYDGDAVAAIVGTATLEDSIAGSSSVDDDKKPITGDDISLDLSSQSASFNNANVVDIGGIAGLKMSPMIISLWMQLLRTSAITLSKLIRTLILRSNKRSLV